MAIDLQRRVGPLPVWAWLASVALGGVLLWRNMSRNPDQAAAAAALSPYDTPGFGLDPGTGAPLASGGDTSGLLGTIDALVQGQQQLGNAIDNLPLLFPTPAEPTYGSSLTDQLGDLGMILDFVGRLGGRAGAPASRPRHRIRRGPRRNGRRTIRAGRGRRDRRTNRHPGHPGEHRNVQRPGGHRQPSRPATRFRARRHRTAASAQASHGAPTRTRPQATVHRGPVAQAHTQRPAAQRSAPRHAAPPPPRRQQRRRGGRR